LLITFIFKGIVARPGITFGDSLWGSFTIQNPNSTLRVIFRLPSIIKAGFMIAVSQKTRLTPGEIVIFM